MSNVTKRMTDAKDKDAAESNKKPGTLSLSGKATLSLKADVGGGAPLRQNVAQSRSGASVAVEVRRNRVAAPPIAPAAAIGRPAPDTAAPVKPAAEEPRLTDKERDARAMALRQAMDESGKRRSTLPKRQIVEARKPEESPAAAEKAAAPLTAREKELAELQRIEQEEQSSRTTTLGNRFAPDARKTMDEEEIETYRDKLKKAAVKPGAKTSVDRRGGRITVQQALNEDFERDRGRSMAAQRRAREKARLAALGAQEPAKKVLREVVVPETITVQELANRMAEPGGDVVKALMKLGVMATITQAIDADTAELIISEFGHKIKRVTDADVEIGIAGDDDNEENMQPRPPIVTIMGHVDHGKTSLLDAMRQTDVVSGEAGGITQHIGAYQVTVSTGQKITFLDTPGHSAFTEMRARGANLTDIVIIVVSAEDSIMPQTIEAINHAKAANVPIIIAINKIDLPNANPAKVKQDLLQHSVVVEEMGGDVLSIEVSAKKKTNLDKLEEMILLQAEILDLKSNPNREAHGIVVESKLEKGRGSVATVLIQKGTLRVGDVFVAGAESGKVRAIINDHGKMVDTAIPGQPVEVLGLGGTPDAGDSFVVVADEAKAREVSDYRRRKIRESQAAKAVKGRTTMDDILLARGTGEKTTLPVIIKGDVHGSVEAIAGALQKMADDNTDVAVQVLHSGVGGITESDITLARASKGVVIGFNVRANAQARDLAQRDGVDIRYYSIIYNVIDDAKQILTGMLSPTKREEYIGQAEILQVFNITKVGKVAGCKVTVGAVKRGSKVRLLRDNIVIHEGMLKTLMRFKDEVKEVKEGTECGMAFETYDDIKEGDVIECFEIIEETRTVS